MWKCKHCKQNYDYATTSEKANHSRWCDKNPQRNLWNKGQGVISKFGIIKKYEVICETCDTPFAVKEREKLHPHREQYFCSRSCANSTGGKAKAKKHHYDEVANYRTVTWRHHERKCLVCGEINVVAAHHLNENHNDNRPENLVPLCPTHHQYMHSRHKEKIIDKVEAYIRYKWG